MAEQLFEEGLFEPGLFEGDFTLPEYLYALQSQLDLLDHLYSWCDFETPFSTHKDRLEEPVQITLALPEIFEGIVRANQAQCRVKEFSTQPNGGGVDYQPSPQNSEVTLADLVAGQDIHERAARVRLFDHNTGRAYLTLHGVISDADAGSGTITVQSINQAALVQDLPRRRLIDLFPGVDLSTSSTNDPRVIKCFSEMRQVRLTKVSSSPGAYSYGAICVPATIATVYRGRRVAPTGEYRVTQVPGQLLLVVFSKAPVDTAGRELEIHVDITCTAFATPADCGRWVLEDAADGLNQNCNSASFNVAATEYAAAGYAAGGGIGPEPTQGETILNQLALRGAVIGLNSAGAWTWTVDAPSLHIPTEYQGRAFGLGRGDGHWENIERVTSYRRARTEERVRRYTMQGLWSGGFGDGSYLLSATATRAGRQGIDLPSVTNPFIGDLTTLRKECGYRLVRLNAAEQQCTLEVINEARVIEINRTVPVTVPAKRMSTTNPLLPWYCTRITGARDDWTLELQGYDSTQYNAQAGGFTSAPAANVLTDFTYTTPDAPTNFAVVSSSSVESGDKIRTVFVTIEADAPAANVNQLVFQLFRAGSIVPLRQSFVAVTAGQTNVRVEFSVQPGTGTNHTYDLQCYAANRANHPEFQDGPPAVITNWIPGTDTTDPTAPVLTQVRGFNQRSALIDWTPPADTDVNEYGIFRQTLPNLVTNPGFELLGLNGWSTNGSPGAGESWDQSSPAHSGTYGATIVSAATGLTTLSISQNITVSDGASYTVGGWIHISEHATGAARILVDTGDGTLVEVIALSGVSASYQFGHVTFTATGTTAIIYCQNVGTLDNLTSHFDDIVLVEGTPAPTTRIAQVSTDRFSDSDAFSTASSYWYAITAYDRSENQSPKSNLMALVPVRIPNEDLPTAAPLALSGLALSSSGTYLSSEGTTLARANLSWTNPVDSKRAYIEVSYRNSANAVSYLIADQVTGTTARIDDLTPGQGYDYRVRGVSHTGVFGSAATLNDQTAPGDTTLPGTVTGVSAAAGTGKSINVKWSAIGDSDLAEYIIYRGTSSNPTTEYTRRRSTSLNDVGVAYDTTYHYRIKARDRSGNISASYSSNTSVLVKKILEDDIPDREIPGVKFKLATITDAEIQNLAVKTAKIDDLAVNTLKVSNLAVTSPKRQTLNTVGPSAINVPANSAFSLGVGSAAADNVSQWGILGQSWTTNWNNVSGFGTRLGMVTRPSNGNFHAVNYWNGSNSVWATDYQIEYW